MEQICNFIKAILKKRKICSTILSLFIMFCVYVVGNFYYIQCDDYLMNYINWGKCSNSLDEKIVFINVIIGKIIKFFYSLNDQINWFAIFELATVIIVCSMLMYIFWQILDKIYGVVIIGAIEIFIICNLTFTVLAYICTATAIIYWMYILNARRKYGTKDVLIISCLFILGVMYRKGFPLNNVLITTIVVMIPILLYNIRSLLNKKNIFVGILLIILMMIVGLYDTSQYSDSAWEKYYAANGSVLDYPLIDYEKNKNELADLGFSQNDIAGLEYWIFADNEVFSIQKMEALSHLNPLENKYEINLVQITLKMLKTIYNYIFLLFVLLCVFIAGKKERKYIIGTAFMTYLMIVALIVRNRLVNRVMFPLFIVGAITILFFICYTTEKNKDTWKKVLVIMLCIITGISSARALYNHNNLDRLNTQSNEKHAEIMKYVNGHKDILFVQCSMLRIYVTGNKPILCIGDEYNQENMISLGDWDLYTSTYYYKMKKYNVKHPNRIILSLAENENMQFIFEKDRKVFDIIIKYLEEHTGKKVITKTIKKFPISGAEVCSIQLK